MRRVGVVGATGYVGAELIRWLVGHPEVELAAVTSRSAAGRPLAAVWPSLGGLVDLPVTPSDPAALADLDAVFLAVPHGAAAPWMADFEAAVPAGAGPVVLDLSRDHRHAPGWVYAQPEWNAAALTTGAPRRLAVPGCFATALQLATAPFVAAGVVSGPVRIVAATGSTGSGATPKPTTHHPERMVDLKAYKVLAHQHVPEVRGLLQRLGTAPELRFVPWSAPVDRGIFATAFVPLTPGTDPVRVLRDAYADAPLVRLREGSPHLRHVRGSAFADVAVHAAPTEGSAPDGGEAVVLVALDNLGKGAASQAIQAFNARFDLPPTTGLLARAA